MMKRNLLCLLLCLALCIPVFASAESAGPVTETELAGLLAEVKAQALAEKPLNDPADESAVSEDGVRFQFETVELYAAEAELDSSTPVNALVFEDSEGAVFRGTGIDTQLTDLLAAFPSDNTDLAGTRGAAVLYLRPTEGAGFVYGRVLRDGQRIGTAEFGEVKADGAGFRRTAVTYSLTNGLVTSIRVEGLNPETAALDAEQATELFAELTALAGTDEYRAVKTSRNGLELTPFGAEDLAFSGLRYDTLTPEELPGTPEKELIDNEDGTWLLRCDGDGYEAVFSCGAQGENAKILSLTLLNDEIEGPRGVRLGDLFSEDFCRFRNGENEMGEDLTEVLYGTEGTAPWGFAAYDPSETCLRYTAALDDGTVVELMLIYEQNLLTEIILLST